MFKAFNRNNCRECVDYSKKVKIRIPAELSKVIKHIQSGVQSGVLLVVEQKNSESEVNFKNIHVDPPWPDFIDIKFVCSNCDRHFKLVANTYQGSSKNGWYLNW